MRRASPAKNDGGRISFRPRVKNFFPVLVVLPKCDVNVNISGGISFVVRKADRQSNAGVAANLILGGRWGSLEYKTITTSYKGSADDE